MDELYIARKLKEIAATQQKMVIAMEKIADLILTQADHSKLTVDLLERIANIKET